MTRYGFRAFAFEGDFGGSQVVNNYVHNKNRLLAYFKRVDPNLVESYLKVLADLNDETVFDQERDRILAELQAIKEIRAGMLQEKDRYIAASSPVEFDLADQSAASIEENATLRSDSSNFAEIRDQYMAEKVSWTIDYEKSQGRGKTMIAGHNGHIEKSAAAAQYRSMGSRLSEKYDGQYFAIGTEFLESMFNCKDAVSGERKQFSVKNKSDLNRAFSSMRMEVAYMDIQSGLENAFLQSLLIE